MVPLVEGSGAIWVAAAMSDADRLIAQQGPVEEHGLEVKLLDVPLSAYRMYYDVVSNATLWFLHHGLFDLSRRPLFDKRWGYAWEAYRDVNGHFAEATAQVAPAGATVLVQDYHLALVPPMLRERRPDVNVVHFSHTPFADPSLFSVLPKSVAAELLEGMAASDSCGFHSGRWAEAFETCCEKLLGRRTPSFVAPLGPSAQDLIATANSPEVTEAEGSLERLVGHRRMLLRVDRLEPSKNILRGMLAFDSLLRSHPELVGDVVYLAIAYPSREGLAEYQAYRAEVEALVQELNRRWATPDVEPIALMTEDNFARSVAALCRYDVLVVNPIRDGLNMVAKEGPLLNRRNGVLVLSEEAGAWDELSGFALGVNPFDVEETAERMAQALFMAPAEKAARSQSLRELASAHDPKTWLDAQLSAIDG